MCPAKYTGSKQKIIASWYYKSKEKTSFNVNEGLNEKQSAIFNEMMRIEKHPKKIFFKKNHIMQIFLVWEF